jgi:hypothetical protein
MCCGSPSFVRSLPDEGFEGSVVKMAGSFGVAADEKMAGSLGGSDLPGPPPPAGTPPDSAGTENGI